MWSLSYPAQTGGLAWIPKLKERTEGGVGLCERVPRPLGGWRVIVDGSLCISSRRIGGLRERKKSLSQYGATFACQGSRGIVCSGQRTSYQTGIASLHEQAGSFPLTRSPARMNSSSEQLPHLAFISPQARHGFQGAKFMQAPSDPMCCVAPGGKGCHNL